jgi:hypothetical protein
MMSAYTVTVQLLFGWAEPYLQAILHWLGGLIGWRPVLYTHWRDVFVMLSMIVAGRFRAKQHEEPYRPLVLVGDTFVLMIATLAAALTVGILPLQSDRVIMQALIAFIPGALFGITLAVLEAWPVRSLRGLLIFSSGVPLLITLVISIAFGTVAGAGVLGLAFVTILSAALYFIVGVFETKRIPDVVFGRSILGGFSGAALFFAVDAGLKLLLG